MRSLVYIKKSQYMAEVIMNLEIIGQKVKKYRRELHTIPETGFEEFKTNSYLRKALEDMGYTPIDTCKTGLLVFLEGEDKSETYAFRTDIDALNIQEETGVDFESTHQGKMHACGHDGHMATLLGFAEYLKDKKLLKNVLLIFQPAEEGPGGAKFIVEEGILDKYNVKAVFGLHLFPTLPEGVIGCKAGPLMAQTGEIDIDIRGKSGHGAMPHTTIDTLLITSKLLEAYQSIVSRNVSPMDNAVLTFGKMTGGTARNIIAENVRIEGTARAFSREQFDFIMDKMCQINRGFETAFGVKIKEDIRPLYPAVHNSSALYERFKNAVKDMNFREVEAVMLAEDFAFYQEAVEGLFFFLGTQNDQLGYNNPLHNCRFNFVEEVLLEGIKVYVNLLKEFGILN